MVVWAVLPVIVILSTIICFGIYDDDISVIIMLFLCGLVLGILTMSLASVTIIYYQKKLKNVALRMEGCKLLDNTLSAVPSSQKVVKNQENVVIVTPGQCHVKIQKTEEPYRARPPYANLPNSSQQQNITTLIVKTESNAKNKTKPHQSTKGKMNRDIKFTAGSSLIKTQENPAPVNVTVKDGCEVVELDQHRPRNPSQLESFC